MSEVAALMARIEALEIRLAHQDHVIEDLNKVTTAQWAEIDGLKRQGERLCDRVQELESNRGPSGLPEPPPPHY
jgi:SlyX protein